MQSWQGFCLSFYCDVSVYHCKASRVSVCHCIVTLLSATFFCKAGSVSAIGLWRLSTTAKLPGFMSVIVLLRFCLLRVVTKLAEVCRSVVTLPSATCWQSFCHCIVTPLSTTFCWNASRFFFSLIALTATLLTTSFCCRGFSVTVL